MINQVICYKSGKYTIHHVMIFYQDTFFYQYIIHFYTEDLFEHRRTFCKFTPDRVLDNEYE